MQKYSHGRIYDMKTKKEKKISKPNLNKQEIQEKTDGSRKKIKEKKRPS